MTYEDIEQIANREYPDIRIPVDSGDSQIQLPDMVVSKQELREAFIRGFQIGYGRGVDKGKMLRYEKPKKSWW